MKYYLFIDESGDHGLSNINPEFSVFLLCGVLVSAMQYEIIRNKFNKIKNEIWNSKEVIFHSRDIRKCEKEFSCLFNLELKKQFYDDLNNILAEEQYTIIASAINKEKYIQQFGRLSNDVYELALSFIIERSVFILDDIKDVKNELKEKI